MVFCLNWADPDSDEVWAPLHAWRALGQLRAESAVGDILASLSAIDEYDSDWRQNEIPEVLALIGLAALPAIETHLSDREKGKWARIALTEALKTIGQRYPSARERCLAILTDQLRHHARQDRAFNAYLISALIDLKPIDDISPIKAAFAADNVDLSVQGDWEEVEIVLGLRKRRRTPEPEQGWFLEEENRRLKTRRRRKTGHEADQWGDVGRNDPCPCGSGRKYKRCHGKPGRK